MIYLVNVYVLSLNRNVVSILKCVKQNSLVTQHCSPIWLGGCSYDQCSDDQCSDGQCSDEQCSDEQCHCFISGINKILTNNGSRFRQCPTQQKTFSFFLTTFYSHINRNRNLLIRLYTKQ